MFLQSAAFMKKTLPLCRMTKLVAAAVFLFTLMGFTACERAVTDSEKTAVLAFSEGATDNLLASLTANDYAQFARDFDQELLGRVPITDFTALQHDVDHNLGHYLSRHVTQVTKADEFYVVVYQASFAQAEEVTLTIAFHDSDHSIATLELATDSVNWSAFAERE